MSEKKTELGEALISVSASEQKQSGRHKSFMMDTHQSSARRLSIVPRPCSSEASSKSSNTGSAKQTQEDRDLASWTPHPMQSSSPLSVCSGESKKKGSSRPSTSVSTIHDEEFGGSQSASIESQ